MNSTKLHAAAQTFAVEEKVGASGFNMTAAPVAAVYSPIHTTVALLECDGKRTCLIFPNLIMHTHALYRAIQRTCAQAVGVRPGDVVVFNSHNHSSPHVSHEPTRAFWAGAAGSRNCDLTPFGKRYFRALRRALESLTDRMQPVSVWWAEGHEPTIAYNRKGRRADGSTYLMREEDRLALGRDFTGDIDPHVPVVCLRASDGRTVLGVIQYAAHPATAYDPENPNIFGEYPQVACDMLSDHLGGAPVGFMQGCSGDINSKGLLTADVARATRHGQRLGRAAIRAVRKLKPSHRHDCALKHDVADIPLAALPSVSRLNRQRAELKSFLRRAAAGDEDTLDCIGLNFPRALTPPYRASLVTPAVQWTNWALRQHAAGSAADQPRAIPMDLCALRLGDVGIVGMPGETFISIGRQIRAASRFPLTIPCGYTNLSYGYIPDGANAGDTEYMSAFYLYSRYRPPCRKPAGDILARTGVKLLRRMAGAANRA